MESFVIFLRNNVLILNGKENKEASAICFDIKIQKKKNKDLLWKFPSKIYEVIILLKKTKRKFGLLIYPTIITEQWGLYVHSSGIMLYPRHNPVLKWMHIPWCFYAWKVAWHLFCRSQDKTHFRFWHWQVMAIYWRFRRNWQRSEFTLYFHHLRCLCSS